MSESNIKNLSNNKMEYLLKTYKTNNSFHTHVSMGRTRGKYNFSRDGMEDFFSTYDQHSKMGIAEKPQHYLPVLGDIDIKVSGNITSSIHTQKHIHDVVSTYQSVISDIVDKCTDKHLTCILLTKPLYTTTSKGQAYTKHGFHLHFPYCFLSKIDQEVHLIPRVKDIIKEKKTFSDIGLTDSSEVIDPLACSVPWLMYGCVKDKGMEPYMYNKTFNSKGEEEHIDVALKDYPLLNNREKTINVNNDIINFLPRILSIVPMGRQVSEMKHGIISPLQATRMEMEKKKERNQVYSSDEDSEEKREIIKKLMPLLSATRASDLMDWLKVGWILHKEFEGSEEGLQLWNDFSAKCEEKYMESVCVHKWDKMEDKDGGVTIASIKYWAKMDSPKEYNKFKQNGTFPKSHVECAELFKDQYGNDYIRIVDKKSGDFYHWDQKKLLWIREPAVTMLKLVSNCVLPHLNEVGKDLLKKLQSSSDKAEEAMHNARLKIVQKIMKDLSNTGYLNSIIKYYLAYDIDHDFETKIMNKSVEELPIKNGKIISLRTLEIRDRIITDYWTEECPVSLLPETHDLSTVTKFMSSITCGSDELVDYHRRMWGYMMTGEISDRSLHIFWGDGCNGKSSIVNIFKAIMGDNFSVNLSEDTMLKKSGRGASPEMMALLHSRCGIMPESDKREILNSKRVKTITGDDTITARHLYGNLIQFKTQTKCLWPSNHLPKIDVDDQAILDRLKLVPFLARFAKTDDNTRYIKDLQENHMDEFFTFFATGARDWYAGEELKPTTEMLEKMNDYISDYDTVQEFINDTYDILSEDEYNGISKLEKNNNRTPKQHVYGCFVGWLNDNNRKDEMITKKEFFKSMAGKIKEKTIKGKMYYLCRPLIHENVDEDDDDDIFPM